MKKIILLILSIVLIIGCSNPPQVVQGTVTSYDAAGKLLVVQNEKAPGEELTFSLEQADIGGEPVKGDIVRISYHETGGRLLAIRIMNLSHQQELKKK